MRPVPTPLLAVAALALAGPAAGAEAGSGAAALFHGGETGIEVRLAGSDFALNARGFRSCAGCHGADGRGGREGALRVPGIADAGYPLGGDAILAAVRDGIDADGRVLARAMPRYEIGLEMATDLAAHLEALARRDRIGSPARTDHGAGAP